MSILIKDMKMPKNCLMCQFHGFGGYKNELIVCSLTGRSEGQLSNVLGCPLVEIPTPHGRLNIEDAMAQSKHDAREGEIPVVMHRKNNCEWLVTLQLERFIELYREWQV